MSADEFSIIQSTFAPLAAEGAARGLLDDAAVVAFAGPVVVTTDALVEGVHFLANDPIDTVARKALRVNLSDLAAKAARPIGYTLTLLWPRDRPAQDITRFAHGLQGDQARYGFSLLGGDTVSTPGPLSISITMFGEMVGARAPDRREAKPGQDVWVSGVIGDGLLGLEAALRGEFANPTMERFHLPTPRLELASCLAAHAGAAMDISDGLLADGAKLCAASGLAMEITLPSLPLSPSGWAEITNAADEQAARLRLAAGGDDYEILFTAEPSAREVVLAAGRAVGIPLTRIGAMRAGSGLVVTDVSGLAIALGRLGYAHELGR